MAERHDGQDKWWRINEIKSFILLLPHSHQAKDIDLSWHPRLDHRRVDAEDRESILFHAIYLSFIKEEPCIQIQVHNLGGGNENHQMDQKGCTRPFVLTSRGSSTNRNLKTVVRYSIDIECNMSNPEAGQSRHFTPTKFNRSVSCFYRWAFTKCF